MPKVTVTLPEVIGRFFVRNTFASNSLSSMSFTIQPAHLIRIEPKKNIYLNLRKNRKPTSIPKHMAKIIAYSQLVFLILLIL